MIHRVYSVFNAQQIDGIPALELPAWKPFEAIEAGEKMLANSGADIGHGGAKAYYSSGTDHVQLPHKECFTDERTYYSTALHELAHWTGAKHRLNRLGDNSRSAAPPTHQKKFERIWPHLSCLQNSASLRPERPGFVHPELD